jgi:hypothetical protein
VSACTAGTHTQGCCSWLGAASGELSTLVDGTRTHCRRTYLIVAICERFRAGSECAVDWRIHSSVAKQVVGRRPPRHRRRWWRRPSALSGRIGAGNLVAAKRSTVPCRAAGPLSSGMAESGREPAKLKGAERIANGRLLGKLNDKYCLNGCHALIVCFGGGGRSHRRCFCILAQERRRPSSCPLNKRATAIHLSAVV